VPSPVPGAREAGDRLASVRSAIDRALAASGRSPGEAALLAVSKTFGAEDVEAFLAAGQADFGESYIQEARQKIPLVDGPGIFPKTWHLIGHLQTNKARFAIQLFDVLHSLDNLALAAELDRRLQEAGRTMRVYVQVNVSGEDVKSGLAPADLAPFLDRLSAHGALLVEGLMTMPPYDPDPEASRPHFARLRELRDRVAPRLGGLSMGMSGDFEVAVSEGATIVRVGTALFGQRPRP
jgi:pyridoxal phosphate enzyme (YggS family)